MVTGRTDATMNKRGVEGEDVQLQPSLSLTSEFGLLGCFIRDGCPPPPLISVPPPKLHRSKLLIYWICESEVRWVLTTSKVSEWEKLDRAETRECFSTGFL